MTLTHAIDSLRHYAETGRPTGGFLHAVLTNDLMEAVGRADAETLRHLQTICVYVYNELPSASWGSEEKVSAWLEEKRTARVSA